MREARHVSVREYPLPTTIVTVHFQTARTPSERSVPAAALEAYAQAIRAALRAAPDVLAAEVDATALPGGASVYVDVSMTGAVLEVLAPALNAVWVAVAQADRTPEVPPLTANVVDSIAAAIDQPTGV